MRILLITPPFCQLNTPYPATAFLKAWLEKEGHEVRQADTGLETFLALFSREVLSETLASPENREESDTVRRTRRLKDRYLETLEPVLSFLQGRDTTLASLLARPGYLPEGQRFLDNPAGDERFGPMGITDLARFRGTLYLEDLGDFIRETTDSEFGFSRYAERLALSPPSFDPLYEKASRTDETLIDRLHRDVLARHMEEFKPELTGFSIPFPGNFLQALRGARFIRQNYPDTHVTAGGGYVSTELREIRDIRITEFFHTLTLDDGEESLSALIRLLEREAPEEQLVRTFYRKGDSLQFSGHREGNCRHRDRPAPDYSDLPMDRYLSLTDRQNPMHRLWSEGPWLKMMLAHGCYWHRCAFCDTSLDYIGRYDPAPAALLADQMEQMIEQTGRRSFHFVDEAAPPALLKNLALELIRRGTAVTWWTNIRFEKQFTPDLCRLLARSGCIAVSGGLEVASDRLLGLMDKGVTVEQTALAARSFREAGILVHTYLMYGFPGQNEQELIDALEAIRQMFREDLIQSAYWHQFALTAHSPVGREPDRFGVTVTGPAEGGFARNDLEFRQESPDLSLFGEGLRTALYNFMRGSGLDLPVKRWFGFRTPAPVSRRNRISRLLNEPAERSLEDHSRLVWIESLPEPADTGLIIRGTDYQEQLDLPPEERDFLTALTDAARPGSGKDVTVAEAEAMAGEFGLDGPEWFEGPVFRELMDYGLLVL